MSGRWGRRGVYCKHNYHPHPEGYKWRLNDPFACDLLAICFRFGTEMPLNSFAVSKNSHFCLRLQPNGVIELFSMVQAY